MKTIKSLVLVMAMAFLYSSCAKDGATGPAGPAGPTGAAGAAGAMGNANVKDSTFIVMPASWGSVSAYEFVSISDPQITAAIASQGSVTVFWGTNGTSWDVLNWTSENPVGYVLDYNYTTGTIAFYFSGGGNPNSAFGGTQTYFKVICTSSQVMKQHPNTNWKDYAQVKAIIDGQNNLKN